MLFLDKGRCSGELFEFLKNNRPKDGEILIRRMSRQIRVTVVFEAVAVDQSVKFSPKSLLRNRGLEWHNTYENDKDFKEAMTPFLKMVSTMALPEPIIAMPQAPFNFCTEPNYAFLSDAKNAVLVYLNELKYLGVWK